jgi:RNA polymerase subunit RPABC4/transcription elongation factor Spt4
MIQCQNCGQTNNYGSNFCRFCGTRMVTPQNAQPVRQEAQSSQPRPYMWKTDEFQVKEHPSRRTQNEIKQVQPLYQQPPANPQMNPQMPQSMAYQRPQHLSQGYQCPRCGTHQLPHITKKISAAGWIVFAVLMVFFFPLFWIGLLIKEEVRVCPVCNARIG